MDKTRIRVGDEYYYIDTTEDMLALVEQKLGWDAHDYFEMLLTTIYDYLDDTLDISNSTYFDDDKKVNDMRDNIIGLLKEIK